MQNSPENELPERLEQDRAERPEQDREQPERTEGGATDELSAELARVEDRYKRALADLDNYRKRASREFERRVAQARESMLLDWLEVVDSVERAMRIESEGPCAQGLRAVLDQMDATLAREGVERIGEPGDRFDPERHDAIGVQPSDHVPDRTVLAVQRSGYALGDRVIRPAQVVVARTPEHAY